LKRVRYLFGVAGLAPAVAGVVIPAAAQAGTAHAPRVKTVSTHHTAVANGCQGQAGLSIPHRKNLKGEFWYFQTNPHVLCIGSVRASMYYHVTVTKCEYVSILPAHESSGVQEQWCASGKGGQWLHQNKGFHRSFRAPVSVCLQSTYDYKVPPADCRNVP